MTVDFEERGFTWRYITVWEVCAGKQPNYQGCAASLLASILVTHRL